MKQQINYLVVPLYGHTNSAILEAAFVIKSNTQKLLSKYASEFYEKIVADCNIILNNGFCPEGIKGIPITNAMLPHLKKVAPNNECFLAVTLLKQLLAK